MIFVGTQPTFNPVVGEMRFNTDDNYMETYDGTKWIKISTVGNVSEYSLHVSTGTVLGREYYIAEPINADSLWPDMIEWTVHTFGPTRTIWEDPGARWYANNAKFWFKDKKDLDWFVLRWSSG